MTTNHVWGADGFCIYCHNVSRADCNAKSTCSDGFTCTRTPRKCDWVQIATYESYTLWARVVVNSAVYRCEKSGVTPREDEFGGYFDIFAALKQKGIK